MHQHIERVIKSATLLSLVAAAQASTQSAIANGEEAANVQPQEHLAKLEAAIDNVEFFDVVALSCGGGDIPTT